MAKENIAHHLHTIPAAILTAAALTVTNITITTHIHGLATGTVCLRMGLQLGLQLPGARGYGAGKSYSRAFQRCINERLEGTQ